MNLIDHFNGLFKVGDSCWLCRLAYIFLFSSSSSSFFLLQQQTKPLVVGSGKNLVLCGDCNGAGFLGGFLSTFDE